MPCNKCCATSDYSRSGLYETNEKRKKIEDLIDRENFKKEKKNDTLVRLISKIGLQHCHLLIFLIINDNPAARLVLKKKKQQQQQRKSKSTQKNNKQGFKIS